MATYEEFKNLSSEFRKELLQNRLYKRLDIAKDVYTKIKTTLFDIIDSISNEIKFSSRYNVHRYNLEAYISYLANQVGEKKVSVSYSDDTDVVDSKEIPVLTQFSYDEADYKDKLKSFTPELAKQFFKFAIPLSESPPEGDIEDVVYAYYFPDNVAHESAYTETNIFGILPASIEYGLFMMEKKQYELESIEGEMVMIDRTIDGALIEAIIFFNPKGIIKDTDTEELMTQFFKLYVHIINYSSYHVLLTLYGHKFKCWYNRETFYVLHQDLRVFPAPIKVKEQELS